MKWTVCSGARAALAIGSEESFAHDPTIGCRNWHFILAESFYVLGVSRYAAALLKEIEMLEGIIGADMTLPKS